jgi:hypothetical protein
MYSLGKGNFYPFIIASCTSSSPTRVEFVRTDVDGRVAGYAEAFINNHPWTMHSGSSSSQIHALRSSLPIINSESDFVPGNSQKINSPFLPGRLDEVVKATLQGEQTKTEDVRRGYYRRWGCTPVWTEWEKSFKLTINGRFSNVVFMDVVFMYMWHHWISQELQPWAFTAENLKQRT